MTVGNWLETWIKLYVVPSGRAFRTVEMYQRAAAAVPADMAAMDLAALDPLMVQSWLVSVAADHARTAQQYRVMILRALRIARKLGYNSACFDNDTVPPIKHKAARRNVLTPPQAKEYISHIIRARENPQLLLCLCGLRRGEALGVRFEDLDQAAHVLHVQRQRMRQGREMVSAPLKSDHADRFLLLPTWLCDIMASCQDNGTGWLVDTTPEDLSRDHRRVCAALGIQGVTLHGLRHTFATLAASEGMSMKLLQAALGHSDYQLTANLYADHLTDVSSLPALVFASFAA